MARVRKAYMVIMLDANRRPGVIYAPTASAAKAALYSELNDVWGISFKEFLTLILHLWRAPHRDVLLPDRHPLAESLTREELGAVVHAHGGTGFSAGYRDYFLTAADDVTLNRCVHLGLFVKGPVLPTRSYPAGSAYFTLTALGKEVAQGEQHVYDAYLDKRYAAQIGGGPR